MQMVKTKQIEKLSDNISEYLSILTPSSRLIQVYSALWFVLSFQLLQAIHFLNYRLCQDDCLIATHGLPSMDVSYSFSISTLFWSQQNPESTGSRFYYLSRRKNYYFFFF